MRQPYAFALVAVGLLAGCVVNPREHFDQVQDVVYARTGQRVHWNAGGAEDQQVTQRVHDLMQHELTVEQVVQIALLNNPDLQATYENLGIAQADLVQAGLLKNPVISAEIRFPGRPNFPVEVNLEDEFLDILFLPLRKKVAEASFEQAKATVVDAVIRRAAEVRGAFYKYQSVQQLLELHRTALATADASLDGARRLRAAGNIRDLDLATEEAVVTQAKLEVAETEAEAAEDREELVALMGLSDSDVGVWKVASRLPDMAPDISSEGLESLAVSQRQDLLAARNAVDVAARTAGMANYAALFSGATIGVHDQRDADVKNTIGPAISAPIPIFDQGQATTARAQAQFRQAQDRYLALVVQMRSQVRKAYNRMAASRQRVMYYKETVIPLRQRIVDQTLLQYNGMFVGLSVLLQAKQEELNAGSQYVEALRDYWIARSELEAAVGGRLPPTAAEIANTQPSDTQPGTPSTMPGQPGMESMPGMQH